MKATNRLATLAALAALMVGVANVQADDKPSLEVKKDKDTRSTATDNPSERKTGVSDFHKASSIVGMKVKNNADETLGTVEDLVLDLKTGKISYAVLGVGGFLGVGEKYIAVPPSAFRAGPDEKTLVLNADKAKLQAATGFAKTNWPDYRNPDFGAAGFWDTEGVGGTTGVTTGSEKSSRDLSRDKKDYKSDQDASKKSIDRPNK